MYLVNYARQVMPPPILAGSNPDENNGGVILAVTGSFTAFACVVVLARIYVRAIMLKTMGADDYVMIFAMICSAATFACFLGEVKLGVGRHMSNPELLTNLMTIFEWTYHHAYIIVIAISSVKISIGFFLLRLVQGKWYKRTLVAWIIFLILFTIGSVGSIVFQCLPLAAAWDFRLKFQPTSKCYSTTVFRNIGLFNGSINIFTDFVFAFLPIPVILPLQINMRTKISLICILSLGYFACAASIVKEVLLVNFFDDPDPFFGYSFQIWNDIELNTGILAACLPALRPLFASLLETASTTKASVLRRTGLGSTRGRYYAHEDEMKLNSMPSRSTTALGGRGYKTSISGGNKSPEFGDPIYRAPSRTHTGPMSRLEKSIDDNDSGSEDNNLDSKIMPLQVNPRYQVRLPQGRDQRPKKGILRTTEVMVSR